MQQLGLFDSVGTVQPESKTFNELHAEYEEKLSLAGEPLYVHVYTQLIWCAGCGNPVVALERKIFIVNKILARGSSEHYETQRALYEQELSRFQKTVRLGS